MKKFDTWNKIKKVIDANNSAPNKYPMEGEIWMTAYGQNIGFEQNGSGNNFSRPVLVIKKFNNQMFWIVPMSTKQKSLSFYYNFTDPTGRNVSVIIAQLKLVSVKRFKRRMYSLSKSDLAIVISKIKLLL
jgi:mRNA interferase MazF